MTLTLSCQLPAIPSQLGSSVQYLASHGTDAERCSLLFPFQSIVNVAGGHSILLPFQFIVNITGDHSAAQADVCAQPAATQSSSAGCGRAVCSSPSWWFPRFQEGWCHATGCEQVSKLLKINQLIENRSSVCLLKIGPLLFFAAVIGLPGCVTVNPMVALMPPRNLKVYLTQALTHDCWYIVYVLDAMISDVGNLQ